MKLAFVFILVLFSHSVYTFSLLFLLFIICLCSHFLFTCFSFVIYV